MPEYVNQLVPMLYTNDIDATMRFYVDELGFRVTGTWPDSDEPTWCSLAAGHAVIMFSAPDERHDTSMTGELYLYPKDIDETWAVLKERVEVVSDLHEYPWGMRDFRIRDPNGYVLIFGQQAEHAH